MKSALLPHSRLLSCGIEQCAEDKCFYERETHRPFPPRQMSSRRSHVCANASICMFMCEQNSDMALQQTDVCEWESEPADKHYHSHLSVRMETGKQQSSQTQTHVHTRTRSLRFWQTWVMPPTLSLVATFIPHSQVLNERFEVLYVFLHSQLWRPSRTVGTLYSDQHI